MRNVRSLTDDSAALLAENFPAVDPGKFRVRKLTAAVAADARVGMSAKVIQQWLGASLSGVKILDTSGR
ncbi:MAG TPA: hypothetical protein VGI32_08995 [Steroidobacteraceae bacterium]|jgi:hypothetical protein